MQEEENPERERGEKINQFQFFNLITSQELSWQAIIYDLIKTEQLDPWDIDLGVLADKYIEVIQEIEEANFFVSSKVLFACSLLLRLKSEILLNKYIQSLDDALYGREEQKKYELERIEIDEDELPILVPQTPMPRYKKVTLKELMSALNKAIETETRRIKRDIKTKQAEKSALMVLPKADRVPLGIKVRDIFSKIKTHLKHPEVMHMKFSELAPTKQEKLASFLPILHLANREKVYLQQEKHFDEILMTLEMLGQEIKALKQELGEISDEENDIPKVEGFKEGLKKIVS